MTRYLCICVLASFGLTADVSGQSLSSAQSADSIGLQGQVPQTSPAIAAQPIANELAASVASSEPPPQCVDRIKAAVKAYQQTKSDQAIRKLLDFYSNQLCTTYLLLKSNQYVAASQATKEEAAAAIYQRLVQAVKTMSQQTGSSVGTGGSTNLVSKGIAAKFISLASEYGALTQSTSNLTTTLQGTFAGLPVLLVKSDIAVECSTRLLASTPCFNHKVVDGLNRFSYGVSFDTSQNAQTLSGTVTGQTTTSAQAATFTANPHTINAVTGKWIAIPGRQFSPDAIKTQLAAFKPAQAANVMKYIGFFQNKELSLGASFKNWQDASVTELDQTAASDADGHKTVEVWKGLGTSLVEAFGVPQNMPPKQVANTDVIQNTLQLALEYETYLNQEEVIAASLAKPAILTCEYDYNRPASQPTNSVFRVIYQQQVKKFTLTANGAISIYDSSPSSSIPGASQFRDAQFALEADHDVSINSTITGKIGMTASGAFYYQYQNSPAILNVNPSSPETGVTFTGLPSTASQVYAQKGNIAIGQLRLTIGSGSNLKVPISVTYSNRTELITKPTWAAQIGIAYDFDSLFGSSK